MIVGVPKEIKNHEYRVGLVPRSVSEFVRAGHSVKVETQAGAGIGASDDDYRAAGAEIVDTAEEIFATAEMVVKVKEPQLHECAQLREGQILYTYLHLAPDWAQTDALIKSGATCIAYETVTDANGRLPLLAPMSRVAGRMSIQAAASGLEKKNGGRGLLFGGVPGVEPAKVLVLGGGVVGRNAAEMAVGLRADVTVLDRSDAVLNDIDQCFDGRVKTIFSTQSAIDELITQADVVIGAVLIPGASAPKLVRKSHLATMKQGAVMVDVAVDQGGCFETTHATTHADPIYSVDGIVHYCVANMPGAVPLTSSTALNNATLGHGLSIANKGWEAALAADAGLMNGLNVHAGMVTNAQVAEAHGLALREVRVA
ncbi:MAG: alanine dehydrogenase [Gammaproteobacteria bacterium]|nr:alanine dehydrogenase [Gammaproteobacteria bacterium]